MAQGPEQLVTLSMSRRALLALGRAVRASYLVPHQVAAAAQSRIMCVLSKITVVTVTSAEFLQPSRSLFDGV